MFASCDFNCRPESPPSPSGGHCVGRHRPRRVDGSLFDPDVVEEASAAARVTQQLAQLIVIVSGPGVSRPVNSGETTHYDERQARGRPATP